MIKTIKPASLLIILKRALQIGTLSWAIVATILLIRLKPQVVLIGVDQFGVRLITGADDRLLKAEQENFLKKYLSQTYNYSSQDYDARISLAGDLMAEELWKEKRKEFDRIAQGLKRQELTQTTNVDELRAIDPSTYEADLEITVKNKLQETKVRLRVEIKLRRKPRSPQNPYEYEVQGFEEHVLS